MHWGGAYQLRPTDDPGGSGPGRLPFQDPSGSTKDDLAYKVEIWDRDAETVEQVLAVTASASIGYAAFYAATREFPERVIMLRHKNGILTRWTGHSH